MKSFFVILVILSMSYPVAVHAKRSFTISEFNIELDALARKYGKMAIDSELRGRTKRINKFKETNKKPEDEAGIERKNALDTSIERHSYIEKEVELLNLYLVEVESKILIFRDNSAEGRVVAFYKSNQRPLVNRVVVKNRSAKFAISGKFIKTGKMGIELDFTNARVIY